MTPTRLLALLLITEGKAIEPVESPGPDDWTIRTGNMSTTDNQEICLTLIGGKMEGRLMAGMTIAKPGIQFKFRATSQEEAYAKADEIWKYLDELYRYELEGFRVHAVHKTTNIMYLGQEPGSTRELFAFNTIATINSL